MSCEVEGCAVLAVAMCRRCPDRRKLCFKHLPYGCKRCNKIVAALRVPGHEGIPCFQSRKTSTDLFDMSAYDPAQSVHLYTLATPDSQGLLSAVHTAWLADVYHRAILAIPSHHSDARITWRNADLDKAYRVQLDDLIGKFNTQQGVSSLKVDMPAYQPTGSYTLTVPRTRKHTSVAECIKLTRTHAAATTLLGKVWTTLRYLHQLGIVLTTPTLEDLFFTDTACVVMVVNPHVFHSGIYVGKRSRQVISDTHAGRILPQLIASSAFPSGEAVPLATFWTDQAGLSLLDWHSATTARKKIDAMRAQWTARVNTLTGVWETIASQSTPEAMAAREVYACLAAVVQKTSPVCTPFSLHFCAWAFLLTEAFLQQGPLLQGQLCIVLEALKSWAVRCLGETEKPTRDTRAQRYLAGGTLRVKAMHPSDTPSHKYAGSSVWLVRAVCTADAPKQEETQAKGGGKKKAPTKGTKKKAEVEYSTSVSKVIGQLVILPVDDSGTEEILFENDGPLTLRSLQNACTKIGIRTPIVETLHHGSFPILKESEVIDGSVCLYMLLFVIGVEILTQTDVGMEDSNRPSMRVYTVVLGNIRMPHVKYPVPGRPKEITRASLFSFLDRGRDSIFDVDQAEVIRIIFNDADRPQISSTAQLDVRKTCELLCAGKSRTDDKEIQAFELIALSEGKPAAKLPSKKFETSLVANSKNWWKPISAEDTNIVTLSVLFPEFAKQYLPTEVAHPVDLTADSP